MGHFDYRTLRRTLRGRYRGISTIVETGTCRGVGTEVMAQKFERVYTIELDETLHGETKARLTAAGYDNITFVQGDSGERLRELVAEIHEPCVFFLDAHWSGDSTVDWEHSRWKGYRFDTAHKGSSATPSSREQVPLDREFEIIANEFPHRCVLYIDDLDKFDADGHGLTDAAFTGEDWSHLHLARLREILGERLDSWTLRRSQLFITLEPRA